MFVFLPETMGKLACFKVVGKLNGHDFGNLITKLERIIAKHGTDYL